MFTIIRKAESNLSGEISTGVNGCVQDVKDTF